MKKFLFLYTLAAVFLVMSRAHSTQEVSDMQLEHSLQAVQQAINVYRQQADMQQYPLLLEYMRYYRSWYQAVTPPPITLLESLSPATMKFVAQIKNIALHFTQLPRSGLAGGTKLSPLGERFYQEVLKMLQEQLIEGKRAQILVLPYLKSKLF